MKSNDISAWQLRTDCPVGFEVFSSPSKSIHFSATGLLEQLRSVFKVFGVPVELASDGGPQFKASSTEKFLSKWGVKHRISSAYFPQSNGRAEVAVKTAKRLLHDNIGRSGSLNNDNFLRAMLQLRNTPDPDCNLSPSGNRVWPPDKRCFFLHQQN